jgi:hypothetical protein
MGEFFEKPRTVYGWLKQPLTWLSVAIFEGCAPFKIRHHLVDHLNKTARPYPFLPPSFMGSGGEIGSPSTLSPL